MPQLSANAIKVQARTVKFKILPYQRRSLPNKLKIFSFCPVKGHFVQRAITGILEFKPISERASLDSRVSDEGKICDST